MNDQDTMKEVKELIRSQYGENKRITDDHYDRSLAVKCKNGTFVGRKNEGLVEYKGIPFVGKQPVGDLRWKAPVDVTNDDGVYEAYYNAKSPFGNEELELGSLYYQGEDCLYLDIWKSDQESNEKRPVMVWVHGGAYESGGTADPLYAGDNFVREHPDIIVVAIEYRLGVFGFLHLAHLPDGKDYPDAQNLGLMDQMMALKWVHENIAAFGGDPDNVTIWGESAGAGSVTLLPLIRGSQTCFKRVIAQSGSPTLSRSPEQAIACTATIMELLGCKSVSDLKSIDAAKLFEASSAISLCVAPERDGSFLPTDPYAAYAKGAAKDIAFLQGCNKDEMNVFVVGFGDAWSEWAHDRKNTRLAALPDDKKALVDSFCDDVRGECLGDYSRLIDQIWFNAPAIRMSEEQTRGGGKSYTYYYTVESAEPVKCGHGDELTIVFNHPEIAGERVYDETFQKTLRMMWAQFARTGDPSLSAEISPDGRAHEWPLYDSADRKVMVFEEFDIHPEKESERKMVDWDRTYFLTEYYCF